MNSSVDQFNISQISLRSSEDDAHKYADDEAPHHPIANPDSNLLHSALKPTKHVNKKKSRKDRNDFIKTRMHRSSKSSKSRSFDMTAADVGGGSVKFNLGGNSAATAPSSSAKMTSKKSSQQDAVHPPITPIPNTLKHIDNYSPLSPPPPMTPISKGTNNENTHENSGMWGSFVSSFSGMSKMLTPKTPSRTPFSRSKDTVGTNTTTPFSVSASQSKIPNNSLLSTPLRFPPVTPHKLPTPHYSAATQSLLFSPKYVPSTSKAPPSSSTMKKQGHVVVRHNLQTYSVNGSDASSGSMSDTSSGDSEEDEQNEEEDPGKQRLFASPKRFANKRLMSFLYKHNFSEDLQHGGKHHRRHSRTYLIAGYCSYCGCVDLEEDYDGEVETSKVQLIPNSAYFVNRNSANVILFSEEGSTIECQTSRKNRLVIRSLQSTQDLSDQGGEVVPDDYYVHNTIISNVTIFDSWFNSTGKRVSCGNRNIRKSTIRCHRYAHKGKNNNSQVSMTVTKDSKDVFAKLAILLQAIPQSTSPNDDENDDDSS